MEGVDMRSLTRYLRKHGTIEGRLLLDESEEQEVLAEGDLPAFPEAVDIEGVISLVAQDEVRHYPGGELRILLVDTGAKENIVRKSGCHSSQLWRTNRAQLRA